MRNPGTTSVKAPHPPIKAPPTETDGSAWQRFKRAVDAHEFAWLPPWPVGGNPRQREIRGIRRLALRLIRQQANQNAARSRLRAAIWPLLLPVKAWMMARDQEQTGFCGRFFFGCRDLLIHNLRPDALRALRVQRNDAAQLPRLYVPDRENQAILIALNRHSPSANLGDKIVFHRFCRRHDLPHVPVLAHSEETAVDQPENWPRQDLFFKAANLWCGFGAKYLRYDSTQDHWLDGNRQIVTAPDIRAWAKSNYQDENWLVQPMLRVDPAWADWSPGPLGTVRVVTTIVVPGTEPEIIAASMRLPRHNMIVDNFSAGALSAEIDWRSGVLQPALSRSGQRRWHDHHPDTGKAITGATVPRWSEICALTLRAHAAAADLMAVGWDVSCHAGQPILVEANPVFNLAPTVVLGETRWLDAVRQRESALRRTLTEART